MCRRETQPKIFTDLEETPGWMSRSVTILLSLGFLFSVVLTIWWSLEPDTFPLRALLSPATGFQQRGMKSGNAVNAAESESVGKTAEEASGDSEEGALPVDQPPSSGNTDETSPEMTGEKRKKTESADVDDGIDDEADTELSTRAEARKNVPVVMYGSRFSPVCAEARTYMIRTGVTVEELDVDSDEEALKRLKEINPAGSLPTLEVDGKVLIGFGVETFEDAMKEAVERAEKAD
jgi:glutaredoxin